MGCGKADTAELLPGQLPIFLASGQYGMVSLGLTLKSVLGPPFPPEIA